MPQFRKRPKRKYAVLDVPVVEIDPNPAQPRKYYDDELLQELAASIAELGVLQTLSVRPRRGRYELVTGERRLRAAKIAGLHSVPCVILHINMEESSLIALVENLERQDLDVIEEAEGIELIMRLFNLSQEETAQRLGRSQSAVANRLRLLKLAPDVLDSFRRSGLTERHGRALLRLASPDAQRDAICAMTERGMNVAVAEEYVESLLNPPPPPPQKGRTVFVIKDVHMFLNSMHRWLSVMRDAGIDVGYDCEETEKDITLTVKIPKGKEPQSDGT